MHHYCYHCCYHCRRVSATQVHVDPVNTPTRKQREREKDEKVKIKVTMNTIIAREKKIESLYAVFDLVFCI